MMDPSVTDLQTETGEAVAIMRRARDVIVGIPARVQSAVDLALAQGASPEVIEILTGLKGDLDTVGNDLSTSIDGLPA